MNAITTSEFQVNGRDYRPPARPLVVICIDGCADEYLTHSIAHGCMPHLTEMARAGYRGLARAALPTFTNVNNASIVTGCPPNDTGICGNYFLDSATGEEVMMNSPEYLRCETILCAAAAAGRKVAFITAKEKLRTLLGRGLVEAGGLAFSSEQADRTQPATHGLDDAVRLVGRQPPKIYSADASIYVLEAGAALLEQGRADWLYLSLTDYMQHKFAPDESPSLDFHRQLDMQIGRLLHCGATVAITADHGMNAKHREDGSPNIIYVESELAERFDFACRVICPITDPYVVHHGALGSLVMVHVERPEAVGKVRDFLFELPGVTEVYERGEACRKLELAADRIGDLVVLSGRNVVLGRRPQDHDLSVLEGRLRSHGGRYEEMVPLLVSEPLGPRSRAKSQADPRNFDVFDFACHATE